jgi:hypothetical protein
VLTAAKLLEVLDGLDPDARVIVGIIDGPRYNAAYADQQVVGDAVHLCICCYEEPRPWEGPKPTFDADGNLSIDVGPGADPERCPACGAAFSGQLVIDPDGRRVCGECGAAHQPPEKET